MGQTKAERVEFADTLRAVAVVSVLIPHYFGVFWGDPTVVASIINAPPASVSTPSYFAWLFAFPWFNWGAFGVALFFLVSGFVIPMSLRRGTAASFLVGRLFRILPVYAVGFTITLSAIWITGTYFGLPWPLEVSEVAIHYLPGLRDLLWSRNIDGIIWTLDIEMKFYVVCAIGAAMFRRLSPLVFVLPLGVAVAFLAMTHMLPSWGNTSPNLYRFGLGFTHATPYLVFMFAGTAAYFAHVKALHAGVSVAIGVGLFVMACWLMAGGIFAAQLPLFAWNYALAGLVFSAAAAFPTLFRLTRLGKFFADISYPLYAVHGVAGYAGLRLLVEYNVPPWAAVPLVTAGAILLSWLVHLFVEIPSHQIGRRFAAQLSHSHRGEAVAVRA